jgi:hypothetical protein
MADLKVGITADDKTAKGVKSATKSLGGLEKGVEGLAKKFAGLFAAQKLIAFGKASVKAFMEDEKSAKLLANTVKNLGLAFETPAIEDFIHKLSLSAGVADEQLRPAMQALITTTGSAAKSQELLAQAIDISRGSGVDLNTVVSDLSNAYVGNTKGLKKYKLGLTQAELKTMSFTKIAQKLNDQFKGSSAAYLDTYAGKLDVLKTAAGEAQEVIGKSLVDSLMLFSGDTSVQDLADSMNNLAQATSDAIYGFASLASEAKNVSMSMPDWLKKGLGGVSSLLPGMQPFGLFKTLSNYGAKKRNVATGASTIEDYNMTSDAKTQATARKKAETAAAKRARELAAAQVKQTKAIKEQTLLKKQSSLFDLQQIGLIAALKGQLSDDERNRVKLQLALLQGNEEEAARLTNQIALAQDATGTLAKYLQTLPDANNPFKSWDAYLKAIEDRIKKINVTPPGVDNPTNPLNPTAPTTPTTPTTKSTNSTTIGNMTYGYTGTGTGQGGSTYMDYLASHPIVVQFQGSDAVTNAMRNSFLGSSLDGSFAGINRTVGSFDR